MKYLLSLTLILLSYTSTLRLELSPTNVTLKVGESIQAQARVYDDLGNEVPAKIQWLPIPDTGLSCVFVSQSGEITGLFAGECGVGVLAEAGVFIGHQIPITIVVEATSEPTPEPTPVPTPEPSPTATPTPTPSPTPKPCRGQGRKKCEHF